jgi:hypothetical protein
LKEIRVATYGVSLFTRMKTWMEHLSGTKRVREDVSREGDGATTWFFVDSKIVLLKCFC